jgi:hypothetical protein
MTRRGTFLAVFGAAYLLVAKSLIDTDVTPAVAHVFRFALAVMPLTGWALLWLVCGAIALADAVLTRDGRDALGFAAAVFAPTAWAIVYTAAWAGNDTGVKDLWISAVTYALIAAAVLIVAGMPDPSGVRTVLRATDELRERR